MHSSGNGGRTLEIKTSVLWTISLIYILILTLKPFQFSSHHFSPVLENLTEWVSVFFIEFYFIDIILNILLFIPFGFFTAYWFYHKKKTHRQILFHSIKYSLLISIFVELIQLFLPRTTSFSDLLMNPIGGFIGARCFVSRTKNGIELPQTLFIKQRSLIYKNVTLLYIIILLIFLSLPVFLNRINNWDNTFHLYIGNEGTGDRQWCGVMYELAIYNRALNQEEAQLCYKSMKPEALKNNLAAYYCFDEIHDGIIPDRSNQKPRLDLYINDLEKTGRTEDSTGIILYNGGCARSMVPAKKLNQLLKTTGQFSIEIRYRPKNLKQTGPARLVSLSANPKERNFMIGQDFDKLNFRVRTFFAGSNGSKIDLHTTRSVFKNEKQHIITVFNRGAEQLFVNGKLFNESVSGISGYLLLLTGFGDSYLGIYCFLFCILLPLGTLNYISQVSMKSIIVRSIFILLSPIIAIQVFNYILYNHPFDFRMLGFAVLNALVITFLCSISIKRN